MDNGKLTDHHGKTVDFRNVILIMTTNAGASDMAREAVGFGAMTREGEDEEAIKRMFTPEFRNRLDAIVPFGYLPPEVVARVVDKFILQLELQLSDRNVHIHLDDESKRWLTERGYDRLYGARPMGRLVQEKIKQPLAEELLFGKLTNGGEVKVTIKDNAPAFEIVSAPPKASKKKGKKAETGEASNEPSGEAEEGQPEAQA
jgi:ATP-dependent Clp protease ATP-binding subunit ClpA